VFLGEDQRHGTPMRAYGRRRMPSACRPIRQNPIIMVGPAHRPSAQFRGRPWHDGMATRAKGRKTGCSSDTAFRDTDFVYAERVRGAWKAKGVLTAALARVVA